jgi:hypothetical protein
VASPEPTDEQLASLVVRALAAVLALLLAGGIATAAVRLTEGGTDEDAADVVVGAGAFTGTGPRPGTALAAYARERQAALAAVGKAERRPAVVSFESYREHEAALEATTGLDRRALLIALPGGRSVEVAAGADLAAVVRRQRAEAAEEKKAIEALLPTVTDPDFRRQYEADLERLEALLSAPAGVEAVVHAVKVVGTGDALRRAARVPGVRLVDAGASTGLRPEERMRAGTPPTRPT